MLKLIIVDDERIIRETISQLINWENYGIQLIGLCQDGMEAYDMILDKSPDIVLTDIKMPGLSGLDLIENLSSANHDIVFILLSGYGEFNYAKTAMKYGVRHYLLKPCNEEQIITSIREAAEECYHRHAFRQLQERQKFLLNNLQRVIITNIINESISADSGYTGYNQLFIPYERFMDFYHTGYELQYIYFLEESCLQFCLDALKDYSARRFPDIVIHGIYVKNTLLLFFQSYSDLRREFDDLLRHLSFPGRSMTLCYENQSYESLGELLNTVLTKTRRYETIYYIRDFRLIRTCNHNRLIKQTEMLVSDILRLPDHGFPHTFQELNNIINEITDIDFLKQLASGLLLQFSHILESCIPVATAEFLLDLNQETALQKARFMMLEKMEQIFQEFSTKEIRHGDLIEKIIRYVDDNLSNPNLTLKSIADTYLYMNVDYVSRRFMQETGTKFSSYVTQKRIQKAKELLTDCDSEKIRCIAEQIGCGNNPQYFSHLFKKYTGITPSNYAKKMNGGKVN
ncbi:response regulator [Lachnospiraceae bacterium 54-53]